MEAHVDEVYTSRNPYVVCPRRVLPGFTAAQHVKLVAVEIRRLKHDRWSVLI